jgi:hypothetical protein
MCISVNWDNDDNSIIRYKFQPGWTWKMLDDAMKRSTMMVDGTRPVDLIFDLSETRTMPDGVMLHLRRALAGAPRNTGFIVVASTNPAIETAFSVLTQVHKSMSDRLLTVSTLDAARAVLAHPYTLRNNISPAHLDNVDLQNTV